MEPTIFVIMGRPASGKGTQAKLLAEHVGCEIVSLGTEFRQLVASDTLVGERLAAGLNAGELAPSWLADYMCTKELVKLTRGEQAVFDSGCRMLEEAILFDKICTWLGRPYKVVYVEVSEEEIRVRIEKRAAEGRADDARGAIDKRIAEFNTNTVPAIDFFRSQNKVSVVDGTQSPEAVQQSIRTILEL